MSTEGGLSIIKGRVARGGQSVEAAYIDLLDGEGGFIAERRTGPDGAFSFSMPPGEWVLVCRAAGSESVTQKVSSTPGDNLVEFELL